MASLQLGRAGEAIRGGLLNFLEGGAPIRRGLAGLLEGDVDPLKQAVGYGQPFPQLTPEQMRQQAFDVAMDVNNPMQNIGGLIGSMTKAGKTAKTQYEIAQDVAQKNAALPISEGGLGLLANNTAMDRAKAMGFDVNNPVYHGTNKEFIAFDVDAGRGKGYGTGANITDNPYVANTYTTGINNGNVMPLFVKENPAIVVDASGKNWNRLEKSTKVKAPKITVEDKDAELLRQLGVLGEESKTVTKKPFNKTLKEMFPNEFFYDDYFSTDDLARFARNEGYGSIKFNDIVDIGASGAMLTEKSGLPSNNQVIFNPSFLRSKFAAFDPFRRNEPDLLAGVGGASLAGLLGLSLLDQQQYD